MLGKLLHDLAMRAQRGAKRIIAISSATRFLGSLRWDWASRMRRKRRAGGSRASGLLCLIKSD